MRTVSDAATHICSYLDEFEEAVGNLCGISVSDSSLIVRLDCGEFAFDFISNQELDLVRKHLAPCIGRTVGIVRTGDPAKPVAIRLAGHISGNRTNTRTDSGEQ